MATVSGRTEFGQRFVGGKTFHLDVVGFVVLRLDQLVVGRRDEVSRDVRRAP